MLTDAVTSAMVTTGIPLPNLPIDSGELSVESGEADPVPAYLKGYRVIALALRLRRIEPEVSTERLHPSMRAV